MSIMEAIVKKMKYCLEHYRLTCYIALVVTITLIVAVAQILGVHK